MLTIFRHDWVRGKKGTETGKHALFSSAAVLASGRVLHFFSKASGVELITCTALSRSTGTQTRRVICDRSPSAQGKLGGGCCVRVSDMEPFLKHLLNSFLNSAAVGSHEGAGHTPLRLLVTHPFLLIRHIY